MSTPPDKVLDDDDPGDDVALRFRYQHCYAAIHALKTVLPGTNILEVICENHEDILVLFVDGTVVAVQIKTRDLSQLPFKAKDPQIVRALARFAILESKFPGAIAAFELLTNHQFWCAEESDNNLPYLLEELKNRQTVKGLRKTSALRLWVAQICEESSLTEGQVVVALLKCRLNSKNNTIESCDGDVFDALTECPGMSTAPVDKVRSIAAALVAAARDASTKGRGNSVLALYEAGSNLNSILAHQQLQAKRLRKEQIDAILAEHSNSSFEQLIGNGQNPLAHLPKKLSALFQKLERGQLETERVLQLEALVHAFEATYLRWVARFGGAEANKRVEDLLQAVHFDCAEAKVVAAKSGVPFASSMYTELLDLLKKRCATDEGKVYNCRPEHLMGAAGVLTQECKVWWSEKFDLTPQENS